MHRAAAEWHEHQGFVVEATRHAQAGRDWRLASRLLADHHIDLTFDGRAGSVAQLLSAFPDDVVGGDAELAVVFATARLLDGSLERSATFLDLAQRLADTVAPERRPAFDLLLAEVSLGLARWRGDLDTVLQTRPLVDAALAAQPPAERTLSEEIRSVALLNLGVAELWSSRLDDARRDLEEALALAHRAGRPWLEVACLGHLAIAGPLTGLSLSAGLEFSEKAVTIADEHGWSEDPIVVSGLATGAMALLWLDAAEPEGIVLPFVLVPVRDLLERLPPRRTAHPTLRQTILDVLDGEAPRAARTPSGPVDELSDAELRVVRYLPSNLRAPEIASELFVSTNTVRTHLRHIYAKLGVHGRAEAVARARELGLLALSHRGI